jgi:hypothetical protein
MLHTPKLSDAEFEEHMHINEVQNTNTQSQTTNLLIQELHDWNLAHMTFWVLDNFSPEPQ